ncbi:ImmA/IrrE family metallo-endopeptidase [Azospirillum sp. TSA6c]|uniref:ImmA/IrrE family metallo-endopeptidase n=1 Tax=unclassified Azospirillum TaxID=2630922 RepID=UPI000D605182|nr:ImmA/IrrE family metallo-endopeptidase [Azospirillum sp. TSA6c]PWC48210.1 hypothetical protein TSA6c_17465 [Azospirillum sp. TSA6c]
MTLPAGFAEVAPSNLPRDTVYRLAEGTASRIGYGPSNLSNLPSLVERELGGRVVKKNFWLLDDYGSIQIRGEADFTIFLPDDATPERDRFTIAHELGHYVLHYVWPVRMMNQSLGPTCASRYDSNRAEWEANWFAAAFLMPQQPFEAAWRAASGNRVADVARRFGVSRRAAEIRARALGLGD